MANVYMGTDLEEFIFGEGTVYESQTSEEEVQVEEVQEQEPEVKVEEEVTVTDEEMNACGVIECVDEPEIACYRIALENEQNYNMIMNAFMKKELSVLESTGAEMVYEAVNVSQFFDNVKKTVTLWWSKIQGVIKKVMEKIYEITMNNKAFVKKYKGVDMKTPESSKDRKFVGYDFKDITVPMFTTIAGLVEKAVKAEDINVKDEEAATEFLASFNEDFDSVKSKMRGAACGDQSKPVSADDFDAKLKIALFGSGEKKEISLKPFVSIIAELERADATTKATREAYKGAQDSVKKLLSDCKRAEAALRKNDKKNAGMKVAKCLSDSINASLGIMSKAMSMYTKSVLTRINQDRAMAAFYVMNQPKAEKKVEKTNESAIDDLNIVLI